MIFNLKPAKEKAEHSLLIKNKFLKKGEVLYRQNDVDNDMFILNKGKCGVYVDDEILTEISEAGAIIGESSALLNKTRSATVIALEDSDLTAIPAEYVDNIILSNPEIGINLIKTIAQRLHYTDKLAADLLKQLIELKKKMSIIKGEKEAEEQYKLIELFYKTGIITENQLQEVLETQKALREKNIKKSVGQILRDKGWATMQQIMQMVRLQYELKNEAKLIKNLMGQEKKE